MPEIPEDARQAAARALFDLVWAKYPNMSDVPHPNKPEYERSRAWFECQATSALTAAHPHLLAENDRCLIDRNLELAQNSLRLSAENARLRTQIADLTEERDRWVERYTTAGRRISQAAAALSDEGKPDA